MPPLTAPLALFWPTRIEITAVHLCPASQVVATGSRSGQVVLWEIGDKALQSASIHTLSQLVPRVIASGDGVPVTVLADAVLDFNEVIVSANEEGTVCLFDSDDGRLLSRVIHRIPPSPTRSITLPGDRHVAFAGNHRRLDVVDVEGTKLASSLHGHNDWICGIILGPKPDGSDVCLLSASLDGHLRYWELPSYNTGSPRVHHSLSLDVPSALVDVCLNEAVPDRVLVVCGQSWQLLNATASSCLCLGKCPPVQCPCGAHGDVPRDSWVGGALLKSAVLLWTSHGRAFIFDGAVTVFCFGCGNPASTPDGPLPRRSVFHYHKGGFLLRGDEQGRLVSWAIPADGYEPHHCRPVPVWQCALFKDGWIVDDVVDPEHKEVTSALVSTAAGGVIVIEGHESGLITISSIPSDSPPLLLTGHSDAVTCLLLAKSDEQILVSGGRDCTTRVWTFGATKASLVRTFSFHAAPVVSLCQPPEEGGVAFAGCFCSVGADQSVVIATMGRTPQCVHLLTGHSTDIVELRWLAAHDHLLVMCEDRHVYVWQLSTGQLDSCLWGVVAEEAWEHAAPSSKSAPTPLRRKPKAPTVEAVPMDPHCPPAQALLLDVKATIGDLFGSARVAPSSDAASPASQIRGWNSPLWTLARGALLPLLLPWGIDPVLDSACELLSLSRPAHPALAFGVKGQNGNLSLLTPRASRGLARWRISSYFTVLQGLSLVALLNALMQADGGEVVTATCTLIIAHVCTLIPEKVPKYIAPSLALLARYWVDPVDEVQEAARSLFGSTVADMTHDERCSLAEQWVPFIPAGEAAYDQPYSPSSSSLSGRRAVAVLVLSVIASEHSEALQSVCSACFVHPGFQSVIARLTRELLFSLQLRGVQRLMGIELLGKGFPVWRQHLPDIAVMVQQLFLYSHVADSGNADEARVKLASTSAHALLVIGAHVPSVFVRVMGHEILRADTGVPEHVSAILALGELVRKSPGPVADHLPRLVESVVRALDPNVPSIREGCLSATVATLHEIVKRYPAASFHQASQRLAVGTAEKLIVLYDLRTASRLVVLEGHEAPVTAVAFDKSGSKLASYSENECTLRVWIVSSTLFGLWGVTGKCDRIARLPPIEGGGASLETIKLAWESPGEVFLRRNKATSLTLRLT